MKKDPSQLRKCPEQCFLRPDLKFFLEFQKKKSFTIFVTLKMNIEKCFFQKKNLSKKFANKIRRENLSTQNGVKVYATNYDI